MGRISATELCQKLKSEAIARQDVSAVFITRNVPDDMFEEVLKARLNDSDPSKEQSRVICAEILKAWRTSHRKEL